LRGIQSGYGKKMKAGELLAGRYELRDVLGCGGMAQVRDGWDTRLNRSVAIKLLSPAMSAQADVRRRFEDEARSAAALNHPTIVCVHDFGDHEGTPFIVMERLPGATLADLIAQGQVQPSRVHAILDDVLAALTVAHGAGVLHRDIKPGNILLSATGDTMKVADFGIAKTAGAALTMTGQIVGTMAYMSPERIAGAPASVADDLYAVGVVGYEALTGRRAFPQDNPASLAHAITNAPPPPPLSAIRPDIAPVLAGVIDRAMTRDPGQRFGSARQMRAALGGDNHALLAGPSPAAVPARPATKVLASPLPPSAAHFAPMPPRRRLDSRTRTILVSAAVLIALAVSVLAIATDSSSTQQAPEPISTSTTVPTPTSTPPPPSPIVQPPLQRSDDTKVEEKKGEGGGNGNGGHGAGDKKRDGGKRG
jgi:serine/threonine protein kinase